MKADWKPVCSDVESTLVRWFLITIFRFHPAVQIVKLSAINFYILSHSNFLPIVSFTYFNILSNNVLTREISESWRLSFISVGLDKTPLADTISIRPDVDGFVIFAPETLMFCSMKCTFS